MGQPTCTAHPNFSHSLYSLACSHGRRVLGAATTTHQQCLQYKNVTAFIPHEHQTVWLAIELSYSFSGWLQNLWTPARSTMGTPPARVHLHVETTGAPILGSAFVLAGDCVCWHAPSPQQNSVRVRGLLTSHSTDCCLISLCSHCFNSPPAALTMIASTSSRSVISVAAKCHSLPSRSGRAVRAAATKVRRIGMTAVKLTLTDGPNVVNQETTQRAIVSTNMVVCTLVASEVVTPKVAHAPRKAPVLGTSQHSSIDNTPSRTCRQHTYSGDCSQIGCAFVSSMRRYDSRTTLPVCENPKIARLSCRRLVSATVSHHAHPTTALSSWY